MTLLSRASPRDFETVPELVNDDFTLHQILFVLVTVAAAGVPGYLR